MASEIEAAESRWRRFFHGEMGPLERDEYYHDSLSVEDRDALCQWASDRMAADRAEREEMARPIDAERVVAVAARLRSYDTCNDDDIDEAAGLLLDLLRVLKGGA